jgi:aldose 1-epimerase
MRYFGAIVGPVANRIAGGRFALDGRVHDLDRNENGVTTLHGGAAGFGSRNWTLIDHAPDRCTLALTQPEGLCGFPGPIEVRATYRLREGQTLEIEITGESGAEAVFAPAFHGYWNLDGGGDVLSHRLAIAAERYTPVDERLIPEGPPAPVAGTAFDYRAARPVAPDVDHNFCTGSARGVCRPVATLEAGGTQLVVETTEPGLQVYSAGRTSSGPWPGLDGRPFGLNAGLALEPQLWPDAPNRPEFPSARIAPGRPVTQLTRFRLAAT